MNIKKRRWIRFRIKIVAFFFLVCMGILLGRAYYLQIVEGERLQAIAKEEYTEIIELPPKRGTIYDREHRVLALSVEAKSIYAHPERIREKGKTASRLADILDLRQEKLREKLNKDKPFVWIQRQIDPRKAEQIRALGFKGIGVMDASRRCYPGCETAAHLIGFVGVDNQGLEGLEKKYDGLLAGAKLKLVQMHDVMGRPFSVTRPVNSGSEVRNLILTIDKDIQYKAQQALKWAVQRMEAKAGHCIVVDPETGEILAMAVVPEFNPNIFNQYKPDQWRNRVVTDCYEPGSTLKAFLLSACLEEEVVTPKSEFDCEHGKYRTYGHVINDSGDYGTMSVSEIIRKSSNIGAIKMGEKLGYQIFVRYLKKFGFGEQTGIGLLGEREGYIRPVEKAQGVDKVTLFFGQGMSVTSLQLVMAMACIANGGELMRPFVVKAITNESGEVIKSFSPRVVRRVISQETCKKVTRILEGVVEGDGTGRRADIERFRVAGKTGTSQKVDLRTNKYSDTKYIATFAGFVPVEQPELTILVVIDEPKRSFYGGVAAAPVFRKVGTWSLNYLRIDPPVPLFEQEYAEQARSHFPNTHESLRSKKGDPLPIRVPKKRITTYSKSGDAIKGSGIVPDFQGMSIREVFRKGDSLGIEVVVKGSGFAYKQEPPPGYLLKDLDKPVEVCFRPPEHKP